MKLPKKVFIAGSEWRVVAEPKKSGGHLSTLDQTLWIGTKHRGYILDTFIHEVLEALFVMRGIQYNGHEEGDFLFIMNHKEFDAVCSDLMLALKDVIKHRTR